MRKLWRRMLVLLAIFVVCALAFAGYRHFHQKEPEADETQFSAIGQMTLPIIYTEVNGHPVDVLHGYTADVNPALLEDRLMPLPSDGKLALTVVCYDCSLDSITWEVMSRDCEESLASGPVEQWTENHETAAFTLDLLRVVTQIDREYRMKLTLTTTDGRNIDYYTRLRRMDQLHAVEMVDYVMAFHNATYDKTAAAEFAINLESDGSVDDNTLSEVSIHSSYQQLTWGDLKPEEIGVVSLSILEMDSTFGSFYLEYEVQAEDANAEIDRYLVDEYFSLQWSEKRFYLMDYRRRMTEVISGNDSRLRDRGLDLGIQRDDRIVVTDAPGDRTVFQTAGELWCYQSDSRRLTRLFSFLEDGADPRRLVRNYHIRVMQTDENGDVSFLVYGYMNSGLHEGQIGVSCLHYLAESNSLEERFFLPYRGSVEDLKAGIESLSCRGEGGEIYLMVGDEVYSVDEQSGEIVTLVDQVSARHLVIGDTQNALAWQMEPGGGETGSVQVYYLDDGSSQIAGGSAEDRMVPVGFIGDDCVLGIGHKGEYALAGAILVEPFYAIRIQDRTGTEVAHYEQEGLRISSASMTNGQVYLERLRLDADAYTRIEPDTLIRNTNPTPLGPDWLNHENDGDKERITLLAVPVTAGAGDLAMKRVESIRQVNAAWSLPEESGESLVYYGYAQGEHAVTADTAGEAIAEVYERMGAVSDSKGRLVWCRTGRQNIVNLRVAEKAGIDIESSRKECLRQILASQGMNIAAVEVLEDGLSAMDSLNALFPGAAVNLTGAPMRSLLYYVNRGCPVLLIDTENKHMLLAGFDPYNVVIFDPVLGYRYKMGQNDATEWLEKESISAIGFLTD